MNLFGPFEISASGMDVQRVRLDAIALNLANAHSTRAPGGGPYKPVEVIVGARNPQAFAGYVAGFEGVAAPGAEVKAIRQVAGPDRLVSQPGHPDADKQGFVHYPNIDVVAEMIAMLETTRAYEANVKAFAAARAMAMSALEVGRR